RSWVVAWGCLAAGLGSLGVVAMVHHGAGGAAGQELADSLAVLLTSGGAAIALVMLTCLGLVVAVDFRLDRVAALAWAHLGPRVHRAARVAWERRATAPAAASLPLPPLLVAPPEGLPPIGGLMPVESAAEQAERAEPVTDPADSPVSASVAVTPPAAVAAPPQLVTAAPAHRIAGAERQERAALATGAAGAWRLPRLTLLEHTGGDRERLEREVRETVGKIEATLASFGLEAKVTGVNTGPTVTQYELQPGAGISVRRITSRQTDLSLALANTVRIEAPIPGKAAIGIEVPNTAAQLVTLRAVVQSPDFRATHSRLAIALGADVSGQPVIGDLARMPHLLIAGATGSGKSVCINTVLAGFLLQATPAQLRLILIDPKRVELGGFADIPHLLVPVVVEPGLAVAALRGLVREMEDRYKALSAHRVRNIEGYNALAGVAPLPRIVAVIDELADLMMVAAAEIEELICRVAQLGRAAGIHLVLATQRPSADIITGLIKANVPSRVAFAVSSGVDSRVILDEAGAEKLLGRGDMLYLPIDQGKARRLQGAYLSDRELERLIAHWTEQGPAVDAEADSVWDHLRRAARLAAAGAGDDRDDDHGGPA
ncbi:MAG TPA: DNA translocase FtsK, partial [Candidatus Dormibacteraeota bacterium]|nr:DNA translocase FtsK [Candidatus Dormibacteraeota bacterium]